MDCPRAQKIGLLYRGVRCGEAPLVEVRMFIYIVLKPKVTGVNMYVNSQHLYIKDQCFLGLLFPSQPCPRYNSISQAPKLHVYFKGE